MAKPSQPGAEVSRRGVERARRAVVDRVADLVWRARGRRRSVRSPALEEPMQRLAEISRGDPDAIRYGVDLDLARRREEEES
jgi:hypothetical protein